MKSFLKNKVLVVFCVICVVVVGVFCVFNFVMYPTKYKNYVVRYSEQFGLESALVYAVIKTESEFKPRAVSSAGARGLMQIIPSTGKWIASEFGEDFNEESLFDPETNIKYGCFYLKYLFDKFGDVGAVICGYNAGETAVKNWLNGDGKIDSGKISYLETKRYYSKVLGSYNVYKNARICE